MVELLSVNCHKERDPRIPFAQRDPDLLRQDL